MLEDAERFPGQSFPRHAAWPRRRQSWTKGQAQLLGAVLSVAVMDAVAVICGALGYYGTRGCPSGPSKDPVCSNPVMYGQFFFALILTGIVVILLLFYAVSRWRSHGIHRHFRSDSARQAAMQSRCILDKSQVSGVMWGECTELIGIQMKRYGVWVSQSRGSVSD